ncbi:hypothetical protein ACQKWADRAFT_322317 [Trichoderma austrokoningii]
MHDTNVVVILIEDAIRTPCGGVNNEQAAIVFDPALGIDLQKLYDIKDDASKTKFQQGIEYTAQQMLARGDAFANVIGQKYKDHVRLFIHTFTGAAKLSINLLPTETSYTTPWHCASPDFGNDNSCELVYENGRLSNYREKSPLLSWGTEKGGVVFEPIYPTGWLARPANGPWSMSLDDIDAQKVRSLYEINSPVILRGFIEMSKKDEFSKKAEDMPYHYDGVFRTVRQTNENGDEVRVSTPPQFQLFMGATSSPKNTGYALFESSIHIFKHLPDWLRLEDMAAMTWTVSTDAFCNIIIRELPLVKTHPTTGKPCLRRIISLEPADSKAVFEAINGIFHGRRVVYFHSWEKGDVVVNDINTLMLHTRSEFISGADRVLWRIHFD